MTRKFTHLYRLLYLLAAFCVIMPVAADAVVSLEINEANFPDPSLCSFIRSAWDHGYRDSEGKWVGVNDGFLTATEVTDVTSLTWSNPSSAQGIGYFPNLEHICCPGGTLSQLNVSSFSKLENLFCENNQLTSLNVSSNSALKWLQCFGNKIESLNVSANSNLERLICVDNPLGKLDVSRNTKLWQLRCGSNDLRELNVSNNTLLTEFECWSNHLTELDLSKNKALTRVLLGVQELNGLRINKTPEGYTFNLKDYVSKLENVVWVWDTSNNVRTLSVDYENGIVLFDGCPREIMYSYKTHSPNNDLLYVKIKSSMNVDVIERGGPTDNIIFGINENNYLNRAGEALDEKSLYWFSSRKYGKNGFVADGNSRLIVRVQTQRPGNVTFELKDNIGVEVERFTNRAKLNSSTPVHTVSIGDDTHQASAVLVAPEKFPSGTNFPSRDFTVHVKFIADETGEKLSDEEKEAEENIKLEIAAAPVLLIHGFSGAAQAETTFGIQENTGIWRVLQDAKFKVFLWNYDGTRGPADLFSLNPSGEGSLFFRICKILEDYTRKGIVCTKIDIVAYSMGGLMARYFSTPDFMSDKNYYTSRSYKQGMIRRFISVASPHRGSPWANYFMGDFSVLNLAGALGDEDMTKITAAFLACRKLIELAVVNPFINSGKSSFTAWRDMAINSDVVRGAYPVNVPMYSIYGKVKDDVDDLVTKLEIVTKAANSVQKIAKYSSLLKLHPALMAVMKVTQVAAGAVSTASSTAGLFLKFCNEIMFSNEDHDLCVSESSAHGDFSGSSTGKNGLSQYSHASICKQQDIGAEVSSLLKGNVSKFKVFDKITYPAASMLKTSSAQVHIANDYDIDPDNFFVQHFTMKVEPEVLSISETGTAKLIAKSDTPLNTEEVYIIISAGEDERIFRAVKEDNYTFSGEIEFTSQDIGAMTVSCFSHGDGDNVYVSDTAQFLVRADTESSEYKELFWLYSDNVIFVDVSSDVVIELYARTSNGLTFNISSPLMGTVWTSSKPSVAFVGDDGLVHALAKGSTKLTASYAGLTASIFVNVGNELEAPQIITVSLDKAALGKKYNAELQASGTPLINWRLVSGRLPGGLELSSEGIITGTLEELGEFTFTVEASNISGSDSRELSISAEEYKAPEIIIDETIFPDENFRNFILQNIDFNGDKSLQEEEISNVVVIDVSGQGINSLKGVGIFSALQYLTCPNNNLTELDLTSNDKLLGIACYDNQLTSVYLDNCVNLQGFWAGNNQLSWLNLNNCTELEGIDVTHNNLTYLDISNCTKLTQIYCPENQLENMNVGPKPELFMFSCYDNKLKNLDVSQAPKLRELYCSNNDISIINLDESSELEKLHCSGNNIKTLYVDRCPKLTDLVCDEGIEVIYPTKEKPTILTGELNAGFVGQAYSHQLEVKGQEYITWTCTTGNFPDGLTLGEYGLISGTPTKQGVFTFTLRASNYYGEDSKEFTLTVMEGMKPTITTGATLKNATYKASYSLTLQATGSAPITWKLVSSTTLPEGLKLSKSTGKISGTPTQEGTFKFKIRATNSAGYVNKTFTLTIGKKPSISTSTLPNGINGTTYTQTIKASGTKDITWSKVSGTIPTGLSLKKSSGKITGTPTKDGTFTFKLRATNDYGQADKTFTITIGTKPKISTGADLTTGIKDTAYSVTLKSKGTTPLTWSKVSGTIPSGLSLKKSSGKITGTPTKSGTFTFKVRAKNDFGQYDKQFTLIIGEKPSISTGATLTAGTKGKKYSVTLKASGTTPIKWTLKSGTLPDGLTLKKTTGKITGTPTKNGTFKFKLKATNDYGYATKSFTLKVAAASTSAKAESFGETTGNIKFGEVENVEEVSRKIYASVTVNAPEGVNLTEKINTFDYVIVAELPVVSVDEEGLYDFYVTLSDDATEGAELIYIANSSEPSEDDEIVEFYDEAGEEISSVPESRKISISIWLNKNLIYSPVIAIK